MKFARRIIVIILVIGGLVLIASQAFLFSDKTTHPYLIEQIIKFYNYHYNPDLTSRQIEWIKQGSTNEDEWPRNWYYHFYDPVRNRGFGPLSAKEWAQNPEEQMKYPGGDHTWQRAISDYNAGYKKQAFISLGHVLHLIEDLAVPAHTREDPHPDGDPLEGWAGNLLEGSSFYNIARPLINQDVKPKEFNNLDDYFDEVANFSNNNFFSQNTIDNTIDEYGRVKADAKYSKPRVVKEIFKGGEGYGYGKIVNNPILIRLVKIRKNNDGTKFYFIKDEDTGEDSPEIHAEYFSLLAREAVINGAGVVKLFFDNATDPGYEIIEPEKKLSFFQKIGNKIGGIAEFIYSAARGLSRTPKYATKAITKSIVEDITPPSEHMTTTPWIFDEELARGDEAGEKGGPIIELIIEEFSKIQPPKIELPESDDIEENDIEENEPQEEAEESPQAQAQTFFYYGSGNGVGGEQQPASAEAPAGEEGEPQDFSNTVIINEIAWMGTEADYADEWIELYNKASYSIDLTDWILEAVNGTPIINLTVTISANGYFLLERTDDQTVPDITADQIYTGALENIGENLKLKDNKGNIIDEINCGEGWFAGDNSTKQTMERTINGWQTSLNPGGTPRAENSSGDSGGGNGGQEESGPTLVTQNITENTTWTLTGSPYLIYDNNGSTGELLEIAEGVTLTIEAGVIVKFYNPGLKVFGTINAQGTTDNPITFTSSSLSPQAGDWSGIWLTSTSSGSILDNTIVRYAGSRTRPFRSGFTYSPAAVGAAIRVEDTSITLRNSIIEHNLFKGVWLINSSSTIIENSTFQNHLEDDCPSPCTWNEWHKNIAIYIDSSNVQIRGSLFQNNITGIYMINNSQPIIENNQFSNNSYPIWVENSYPQFSSNQLENNNWNGIVLRDIELNQDYTLAANSPFINYDYPYNSIVVPDGRTLTMEPGTIIKSVYSTSGLQIEGTLIAEGTAEELIVFTSFYDDEYGGDTNGDGDATAADAKAGIWGQVVFAPTSVNSSLAYVVIRYGGTKWMQAPISQKADYVLDVDSSDVVLANSTMEDNTSGLYLENSSSQITNTTFQDHQHSGPPLSGFTSTGIRLISSNATIDTSTLSNNKLGLYINAGSLPTLLNLTFTNNVQDMEDLRPPEEGDSGGVEIIDIFYDGVEAQEADEYVEIKNFSDADVDLEYWTLSDEASHEFTFPYHNLEPAQSVKVYTNMGTFSFENGTAIWNNTGDTGYLRNRPGDLIDFYSY